MNSSVRLFPKPHLTASDDRAHEVARWLPDLLAHAGSRGFVMQLGSQLVVPRPGPDGGAERLVPVDQTALKDVFKRALRGHADEAQLFDTWVRGPMLGELLRRHDWPGVERVAWVTQAPVLVPWSDEEDGTSGVAPMDPYEPFDQDRGIWYDCPKGALDVVFDVPLEEARVLLLDELMGEFPFADEASRANALAMLLTPFLRPLVDGPTPLFLLNAPRPRTGKSLLAAACLGVSAPGVAGVSLPSNESQVSNLLNSKLRSGAAVVWLDNVKGRVDSPRWRAP
jgi:hypothetical protein